MLLRKSPPFFCRLLSLLLGIALLPFAFWTAAAQPGTGGTSTPTSGGDLQKLLGGQTAAEQFTASRDQQGLPLERRINPDVYRVGPNDQLVISASGLSDPIPVVIGLDNFLIVPRFRPVNVEGLTLSQLERILDSIYSARSSMYGDIHLSLLKPRTIYVTVAGNVIAPGRYIVSSADRATTAIDLASKIPEELATVDDQFLELSKRSVLGSKSQYGSRNLGVESNGKIPIRSVVIRHADGTATEADLVRYRAFGTDEDNPTLREGDNIIVEFPNPIAPSVSIAGAVNNPLVAVPYRDGDNLAMLVRLAAGVRADAQPREAYVIRGGGTGEQNIGVDLTDSLLVASFDLQEGDQVIVPSRGRANIQRSGVVTVEGEVVRPQAYAIVPGETTLSQVIERAGGFTPFASLNGSYIRRPDDPLSFRPQQLVLDPKAGIATSPLSLEDTTRFKFDQQLQQNMVSADFVAIFRNGDRTRDVILQSGDEIMVPRELGQVYVSGRVRHPGWVTHRPGEMSDYYIAQAGGYTEAAAPDRVTVEKFGTGIWDGVEDMAIESGDKIYVPGERDTPARTALEQTSTILLIVSSALSIIRVVIEIIDFFNKDNP